MNEIDRNTEFIVNEVKSQQKTRDKGIHRIPASLLPWKMVDLDYGVIVTNLKKQDIDVTVEGHQAGFPGTGAFVIRW